MVEMSPENIRFLVVMIVGPGATVLLYSVGYLFDIKLLMLPGKVVWSAYKAFAGLLALLSPIAYFPLLLIALGVLVTVPGAWLAALALGIGHCIFKR